MKKMMKKVISITLIMIMVLSVFSGCGSNKNKKVELVWAGKFLGTQEEELVLKEFNKRLEKLLPNTTVKFIEFDAQTWSLWMSEGKEVDIAWSGYQLDMLSEVKKGSYRPLDDLIQEYAPNIQEEMKTYEKDYQTAMYDGKLYFLPNQQARIKQTTSLDVPESLWKYMDVDALIAALNASPYLTKEIMDIIDSYLTKVYASSDYDTDVVGKYIYIEGLSDVLATRGYEMVAAGIGYDMYDDNAKFINLYETEQYKMFAEYAASWKEKGYIAKDTVTVGNNTGRSVVLSGEFTKDWYPTTVEGKGEKRGVTYIFDDFGGIKTYSILLSNYEQMTNGISDFGAAATYLSIPYTSKNAERAIQLLDLLRAPKGTEGNDLLNLLCYGFEENSEEAKEYGTYHYTLNEEGRAQGVDYTMQPSSSSKYGMASWAVGNAVLAYLPADLIPGVEEYVEDYTKNIKPTHRKTAYYQFLFDSEPVASDLQNITNVLNEYQERIAWGTEGAKWESSYNTMIEKMKQAGIEKVIKEMQEQADKFMKNK